MRSRWRDLRNPQRLALKLSAIGITVANKIGEKNDIHPLNKEEVDRFLALGAMKGHSVLK